MALIVADYPAQGVAQKLRRRPGDRAGILGDRHVDNRPPHCARTGLAEEARRSTGDSATRELDLDPPRHVVRAGGDAARRRHLARRLRAVFTWGAGVEQLLITNSNDRTVAAAMRPCAINSRTPSRKRTRRRAHAGGHQQIVANEFLPRTATYVFDQLACGDIEDVVVGVGVSEACGGAQVAQATYSLGARQGRARKEQQISFASAETAAMHQQIKNRDFSRHPRVIHLKARDVIDHRIVPANLTTINQHRERSGRERLAERADLENRVRVNRIGAAETPHAIAACKRDLTMLDDGHRHPRHAGQLHGPAHQRIYVPQRIGKGWHCHEEEEWRQSRGACVEHRAFPSVSGAKPLASAFVRARGACGDKLTTAFQVLTGFGAVVRVVTHNPGELTFFTNIFNRSFGLLTEVDSNARTCPKAFPQSFLWGKKIARYLTD